MTSNLGTEFVRRGGTLGFLQHNQSQEEREAHDKIEKALKSTFKPEFLNRIDEIIMFSPLVLENMYNIVDLQLKEVQQRLSEFGLKVELSKEARGWLAEEGFDPSFGARPLRRALQKYIESPLSIRLLSGEFILGDTVLVDVEEDQGQENKEIDKKTRHLVFTKAMSGNIPNEGSGSKRQTTKKEDKPASED
jgi:ATP-dependent Clp protease ATP-binding subunit ClpC